MSSPSSDADSPLEDLAVTPSGDDEEVLADLVPERIHAARDGASPARLAELEAKIARATARTRSEPTLRAYRADWADFTTWCSGVGLSALPAAPATVAAYVAELADPPDDRAPRRVSTITRRLAAISEGHKVAGQENPTRAPLVAETMKLRRAGHIHDRGAPLLGPPPPGAGEEGLIEAQRVGRTDPGPGRRSAVSHRPSPRP